MSIIFRTKECLTVADLVRAWRSNLPGGFFQAGGDPPRRHPLRQRHDGRFGNASPLRRARAERRAFVGYGGERAAAAARRFRCQQGRPLGAGTVDFHASRGHDRKNP